MNANHANLGGDIGAQLHNPAPAALSNVTPQAVNLVGARNHVWMGWGLPPSTIGTGGDYYFRLDAGAANTHVYYYGLGWQGIL